MKDQDIRLSIIIPHYNTPGYLHRLLKSIGKHPDVRVIVVDDHSDKDPEGLEGCMRDFSHVIFRENRREAKGAGAARNTGLKYAKGEWLMFADADDEFLPGWYEHVAPYFLSAYDLVYFMPVSRKPDGSGSERHKRFAGFIENYLAGGYGGEERLRYRFSVPWSKLIRASVVFDNHIRFDEIQYSNDVMFSVKVGYHAGKMTADRNPVYCVIEHKESLTKNNPPDVYCARVRVICEHQKYLNSRFSGPELDACGRISQLYSMKDALQKGYPVRIIPELARLFREYRIPLIVINIRKYMGKRPAASAGEKNARRGKRPAASAGEKNARRGKRPAAPAGEKNARRGKRPAAPAGKKNARRGKRPAAPAGEKNARRGKQPAASAGENNAKKREPVGADQMEKSPSLPGNT